MIQQVYSSVNLYYCYEEDLTRHLQGMKSGCYFQLKIHYVKKQELKREISHNQETIPLWYDHFS